MNSSTEIKKLAEERLEDAKVLAQQNRYDSAFYLAGYSVELMLKAKICQHLDIEHLFAEPNHEYGLGEIRRVAKTHDFAVLLNLSGLGRKFNVERSINQQFESNCSLLFNQNDGWSENVRYKRGHKSPIDVNKIINFLTDSTNGLLQWIEKN